jgi:hypothetical protein
MMDSWESFFREKSSRRASAAAAQSIFRWSAASLALLLLVAGVLRAIDI